MRSKSLSLILVVLLVLSPMTALVSHAQSCAADTDYITAAGELIETGDYEAATEASACAAELDPQNADAYTLWGLAFQALADDEAAIEKFNAAIALTPDDPLLYVLRGQSLQYLLLDDDAIADFDMALELDPENVQALIHKAVGLQYLNFYEESLVLLSQALELDPTESDAYGYRGMVYQYLFDDESALADFNAALELDPENAVFYAYRAESHGYLGDIEAGRADLDIALELDPENLEVLFSLGYFLLNNGDSQGSVEVFSHLIESDPTLDDAYLGRALGHIQLEEDEFAVEDLTLLIEAADEPLLYPLFLRGQSYYFLAEDDLALADLEAAEELASIIEDHEITVDSLIMRSEIYIDGGNLPLAKELFTRAATIAKTYLDDRYLAGFGLGFFLDAFGPGFLRETLGEHWLDLLEEDYDDPSDGGTGFHEETSSMDDGEELGSEEDIPHEPESPAPPAESGDGGDGDESGALRFAKPLAQGQEGLARQVRRNERQDRQNSSRPVSRDVNRGRDVKRNAADVVNRNN